MPNPDSDVDPEDAPEQPETNRDPLSVRLVVWWSENVLLSFLGLLMALLVLDFLGVNIPGWLRLGAPLGVLAYLGPGRYVRSRVRDVLDDQLPQFVVDVDARDPASKGALYAIPAPQLADMDVVEGSIDRAGPHLVFAKQVDLDAGQMLGTWRGSASDRELLANVNAIRTVRDRLEDEAKAGLQIRANAWAIVRAATVDALEVVVDTFQRGTLPDEGQGVQDAIDDALDQAGVDQEDLSDPIQLDDLGSEDLDDLVDAVGQLNGDTYADLVTDPGGSEAPGGEPADG